MTVIATASNPRFTVSRVDIDRPGMTYTVDTLKDVRAERGEDVDLYFITGADAMAQILTWRDADRLFDLAHFVGCTRPGVDLVSATIAQLPQNRVTLMEIPALAISSTACRVRVGKHGAAPVSGTRRHRAVHRQAGAICPEAVSERGRLAASRPRSAPAAHGSPAFWPPTPSARATTAWNTTGC